jgi:aminopeptidase N
MYYKGGNMLHTLRQIIDDDEKWRSILRGLNETFYHQTVTSQQVENYIAEQAGLELDYFFDQYLRDVRIPILEYYVKDKKLFYRWGNCVSGFRMPVKVTIGEKEHWLKPFHPLDGGHGCGG